MVWDSQAVYEKHLLRYYPTSFVHIIGGVLPCAEHCDTTYVPRVRTWGSVLTSQLLHVLRPLQLDNGHWCESHGIYTCYIHGIIHEVAPGLHKWAKFASGTSWRKGSLQLVEIVGVVFWRNVFQFRRLGPRTGTWLDIYHLLSSSIIFYHLLSSSIIFYHLLSSSIIFYHLLSSSIIFYHLLSSSGGLKTCIYAMVFFVKNASSDPKTWPSFFFVLYQFLDTFVRRQMTSILDSWHDILWVQDLKISGFSANHV